MTQEPRTSIHARTALDEGMVALQRQLRTLASLVDVAIERSVRAMSSPIRRISASFIPRVVTAGVPTRMPDAMAGLFVS